MGRKLTIRRIASLNPYGLRSRYASCHLLQPADSPRAASEQQAYALTKQRGDTLVEVLMAIVVLSMVIVGAITVMAHGLKASQLAVEHTQVRLQINAQEEMLRYLRDGYLSDPNSTAGQTWKGLFGGAPAYADTTATNYNDTSCSVTSGKNGFYLTQSSGVVSVNAFNAASKPATYALPGQGMWIEMTRSSGISPAYVDVVLRACWSGIGDSADQQAVTVIRLYDPAH
jgi:prepilin-type N-terminal cleavage/methylation domain-containing protein